MVLHFRDTGSIWMKSGFSHPGEGAVPKTECKTLIAYH